MPKDAYGSIVKVGDEVLVRCRVAGIGDEDEMCNVSLVTTRPMPPSECPIVLRLNSTQLEVQSATLMDLAEVA